MGERMTAEQLKSRLVPFLLGGARRDNLDSELLSLGGDRDRVVLNALSLAGQALRFTRPAAPAEYVLETWPQDERPIVPDGLRTSILRLLDKCTEDTARALALALEKQRFRPHPFDLPKLGEFIRKYSERLGVIARYWAERETPTQQSRGYFEADELTAETWTEGPLRTRTKFLRELRKRDAGSARALLEKSWAMESADSRAQLLSVLQTELATEDREFLEGIRKDRAPRVRAMAQRFVAALSGSANDNPALAACMERIQKSKAGLLKKREELKLELPATVKEHERDRWILQQFADVTLDELAKACGMTDAMLVDAAAEDSNLLYALALMSSREKRFDLLAAIADEIPDAWGRMSDSCGDELPIDESGEKAKWAEALLRPKKWLPDAKFPAWSWLHQQMEGPLPASVMRDILQSSMWSGQLDGEKKPGAEMVQVMCVLCPEELRGTLRVQIEPLDAERKDKGWMLLEILDALERLK
jgi:hypothetical protein